MKRFALIVIVLLPASAMAQQNVQPTVDGATAAITRNATLLGDMALQFNAQLAATVAQLAAVTKELDALKAAADAAKSKAKTEDKPK
jgi:hypothetical protein